jgi:hypothetical protein
MMNYELGIVKGAAGGCCCPCCCLILSKIASKLKQSSCDSSLGVALLV